MTMLHKSFGLLEVKADGDAGEFTALVSTFGNVDKVGDRIIHGAYAKTLAKWQKSGDPLPIILAHQWDDVMAHVGYAHAEDIKETSRGLVVKGTLDVEDNPVARQVHKLMKRRTLKEFSIGYSVPPGGEHRAKDGANEITEIELAECGPCLKGIDPKTELHAVKSALGVEEPPKGADELREEAKRVARDEAEARFPNVPPAGKRLASDVRELLDAAGATRFERTETKWVYVDDYDPDAKWAVFSIADDTQRRYVQVGYTLNGDGSVTLGDAETEVVRTTSYRAANGAKAFTASELEQVKAELAVVRQGFDDLKKQQAEVTGKEPSARSVDPLRKQADAVALEFASDGQSLRKQPKTPAQPKPEPELALGDLKRRMREEILVHLSGGIPQ